MAVTKLRDRLQQLKAQEDNERRWQAYEKAKAERDKLAGELKDIRERRAPTSADGPAA